MPSSISCCRRCSPPPPYRRSVTLRAAVVVLLRRRSRAAAAGPGRPGPSRRERVQRCGRRAAPRLIGRGRAVRLAQQRQRQPVGVEDRVGLLLPAVAGERLAEVAGLVEQPDADDRHAEVGRGLEVVTGEDAEAAGVLRQHRGDAELGGEVGDGPRARSSPTPAPTAGTSDRRSRYACRSAYGGLHPPTNSGSAARRSSSVGDRLDSSATGSCPTLAQRTGVDRREQVRDAAGARTSAGCWPVRRAR